MKLCDDIQKVLALFKNVEPSDEEITLTVVGVSKKDVKLDVSAAVAITVPVEYGTGENRPLVGDTLTFNVATGVVSKHDSAKPAVTVRSSKGSPDYDMKQQRC